MEMKRSDIAKENLVTVLPSCMKLVQAWQFCCFVLFTFIPIMSLGFS